MTDIEICTLFTETCSLLIEKQNADTKLRRAKSSKLRCAKSLKLF